jgi:peptidoglycan/LPS O-acetylase OafA/YrhL
MSESKPFIRPLTGIRFVAAAMVMVGHGSGMLPIAAARGVVGFWIGQVTSVGMSLFFVLSGYVIWINYAQLFHKDRFFSALRSFAVARFARLYPMYAFVLTVMIALGGLQAPAWSWPALFWPMLQAWVPGSHGLMAVFSVANLGHLWSISVEVFFYVLFPFVALSLWHLRSRAAIVVALAANSLFGILLLGAAFAAGPTIMEAIAPTLGKETMAWLTYYAPYVHIPEFIGGCLAAAYVAASQSVKAQQTKAATLALDALFVGLFALLPILLIGIRYFPESGFYLSFCSRIGAIAIFPLLLIHIVRSDGLLSRGLSLPLVVLGGEWSYSIYLLHPLFIHYFEFHDLAYASLTAYAVRLAAYSLFVITLAGVTFTLIENPARSYLRRTLKPSNKLSWATR